MKKLQSILLVLLILVAVPCLASDGNTGSQEFPADARLGVYDATGLFPGCLVSFNAQSYDAQSQGDLLLQELYVKSGAQKQLEQLPLTIQAAFDQAALGDDQIRKLPRNLVLAMRALAGEAFAPGITKDALFKDLKEKLTTQDMEQVLKWLDSPLGKKCTQMEEAASTPEAFVEMQQFAARMQNSPPTADRLKVLLKLDSAIKATETSVEMAVNTQAALALAINSTLPLERQRSFDDVAHDLEKSRSQIEAAARSETQVALLYTYRNLSEAEVQRYVDLAKSPIGSKFQSVCTAALKKAFSYGIIKWGKAIGDAIKQIRSQSDT